MNIDEIEKALKPPEVTIDGQTYTGRILSIFEMQELHRKLEAISTKTATDAAEAGDGVLEHVDAIAELICTDLIPGLPLESLKRRPVAITFEVFQHFLATQLRGMPAPLSTRTPVAGAAPVSAS